MLNMLLHETSAAAFDLCTQSACLCACKLQGEYHMFIAQTPFIDPMMFQLAIDQNNQTGAVSNAEKLEVAWWVVLVCRHMQSPQNLAVEVAAILYVNDMSFVTNHLRLFPSMSVFRPCLLIAHCIGYWCHIASASVQPPSLPCSCI